MRRRWLLRALAAAPLAPVIALAAPTINRPSLTPNRLPTFVRHLKDERGIKRYGETASTEIIQLMPKAPWVIETAP
jgi:hypothetical protein